MKSATWKQVAAPTIDPQFYVLLYTHFGIPAEQNYSKMWFDQHEEEIVRVTCRDGIEHWWRTSPWLDIKTVVES